MNNWTYIVCIVWVALVAAGCSGTRCLSEGESLYVGSRLKVKKQEGVQEINHAAEKLAFAYYSVWDEPNGALFGSTSFRGIPFRLIVYNWFCHGKEKGFSNWMRNNFGEEPILLSDIEPELKVQRLIERYEDNGHFGTTGSYELKYRRKGKKVFVKYRLLVAEAYVYRDIEVKYDSAYAELAAELMNYQKECGLKSGQEFSTRNIQHEKQVLWQRLRNAGFYYVREGDIIVEGDTTVGNRQVDIRFRISNELSGLTLQPVQIHSVGISVDSVKVRPDRQVIGFRQGKLKRSFLEELVLIKPDTTYTYSANQQTTSVMGGLGIFQSVVVTYEPVVGDSLRLKAMVNLKPQKASSISLRVDGNYKAAGYIGPSIGLQWKQLNLFGKAQNYTLDVNTYYDFPIGVYHDRVSQAFGFSVRNTLRAPLINSWIKLPHTPTRLPEYVIGLNAEYLDKRDFFEMSNINASFGFVWNTSRNDLHRLDILNASFSDLINTTERLDSLFETNKELQQSMVDQFVFGTNYRYTLDKRTKGLFGYGFYMQAGIGLSGNTLALLNELLTKESYGEKKFLGVRFSQYMQVDYNIRYAFRAGKRSVVALRHIGGFGIPYGNSEVMPYTQQYFIGGINSLRPFSARTVGPGRYIELDEGEVNQVGDVKLELNIEFRIRLGVRLSAAIWSDMGNIWLMKEDPDRPYSGIRWNHLAGDSYLTGGLGLRLDLNYLIIRADYGAVIYAPIFIDGYKWLWQNKLPLWGPVIAFGLPF